MPKDEYLSTLNCTDKYIPKEKMVCNACNSEDLVLFNMDEEKCIECGLGNYVPVKWFNDVP